MGMTPQKPLRRSARKGAFQPAKTAMAGINNWYYAPLTHAV
jgi:hypothetical protein